MYDTISARYSITSLLAAQADYIARSRATPVTTQIQKKLSQIDFAAWRKALFEEPKPVFKLPPNEEEVIIMATYDGIPSDMGYTPFGASLPETFDDGVIDLDDIS